jgi:RHS repeat-associated protein
VIGEAARKAGINDLLRFAEQYFGHETVLHYKRQRHYAPYTRRDTIARQGEINVYTYALNAVQWIDP